MFVIAPSIGRPQYSFRDYNQAVAEARRLADIHQTVWAVYPVHADQRGRRYVGHAVASIGPTLRGMGDVVAKATKAAGIQPCAPCERRRRRLNRLLPFR